MEDGIGAERKRVTAAELCNATEQDVSVDVDRQLIPFQSESQAPVSLALLHKQR